MGRLRCGRERWTQGRLGPSPWRCRRWGGLARGASRAVRVAGVWQEAGAGSPRGSREKATGVGGPPAVATRVGHVFSI